MKKKVLAFVLAAAMAFSLAGCGGEGQPVASQGGEAAPSAGGRQEASGISSRDTLVIANTSGEPGNLHPYNQVSVGAVMAQRMIFDSLVSIGDEGTVQPELAESWEVTEDAITFHLRQGVKFHNGDAMTAEDVKFSFDELVLNSTGGRAPNFSACDMENVTTPDDYTMVVPLKEDNVGQLSYFNDLLVVNKAAYEEMGDKYQYEPVGTGAFRLASWTVGDNMTFEANENYWRGVPKLKTVVMRTITEASQAMIEVETGGADVMIGPDGSDVVRIQNGEVPGVKAITDTSLILRNNNVQFNHNSPYMSNKLVREAVARCIDREAWANIISPGIGVVQYCNVASGVWGWDETLAEEYPYTYDLESAKACLAEAGYPDGFTCVLYTDGRSYHQSLAELLQASLSQAGIRMEIQTMELNKQKELMSTGEGYDLFLLDNVGNPGDALSPLWRDSNPEYSGEGGSNYLWYTADKEGAQEYVDMLHQIRACYDDEERQELCKEMQRLFAENLVWLPVNSNQTYIVAAESLQNVSFVRDILWITSETYFE